MRGDVAVMERVEREGGEEGERNVDDLSRYEGGGVTAVTLTIRKIEAHRDRYEDDVHNNDGLEACVGSGMQA